MLDTLRKRSQARRKSLMTAQTEENLSTMASYPPKGGLLPYDIPLENGKCYMSELPAEVLTRIFLKLDRASLTRCYRLCKDLNEFLSTNSSISLHHTLQCNSLLLNPRSSIPPASNPNLNVASKSELLSTLRERLTGFRNFKSKRTTMVQFKEEEGNLYEYLEGVLMRGIKPWFVGPRTAVSREVAFYDLRQLGEWEDEPISESVEQGGEDGGNGVIVEEESVEEVDEEQLGRDIRRSKKFDFAISEFAVDPGQDLLVLVEVTRNAVQTGNRPTWQMFLHLFSLETLEPHPRAKKPILEWPDTLVIPRIELGFQICDDGLFVLKHHRQLGPQNDKLYGWQWTTGRLGVRLGIPNGVLSYESFVLVSPSAFVIPTITARLDRNNAEAHDDLDNPDDLIWSHSLALYAFPPFGSVEIAQNEPVPPPHTATHVATLDLPRFFVDLRQDIPPPRMTVRTDPPPRHTLPTHPRESINPFAPTPESGLIILDFFCQLPGTQPDPHYSICLLKSTLAQYLPAPTSAMLTQAFERPAPVVPWSTLAPHVRMFGPELSPTTWVCYVYQNRYATIRLDMEREEQYIRLYDFDPLRVRKEACDRKYNNPPVGSSDSSAIDPLDAKMSEDETRGSPGGGQGPSGVEGSPTRSRGPSIGRRLSDLRQRMSFSKPKDTPKKTVDGDRDGIVLVTESEYITPNILLPEGMETGRELPYVYVERRTRGDNALIDGERIVIVHEEDEPSAPGHNSTLLEVMEF